MICSLLWGEALFRPSSLAERSMNDEEAFFRPKEERKSPSLSFVSEGVGIHSSLFALKPLLGFRGFHKA